MTSSGAPSFDTTEFNKLYETDLADLEQAAIQLREIIERAIAHRADKDLVRTHLVELRIKSKESLASKAIRNGWTPKQALLHAPDVASYARYGFKATRSEVLPRATAKRSSTPDLSETGERV